MSRGSQDSQETRAALLGELARELRRFTGLGASFVRAAAARTGMAVTDIEVIDILESIGPTTAGQLAELTGLTTGAITGMLKRLEEAGYVRREDDPEDGRRVIVRPILDKDAMGEINAIFASLGKEWSELASHYDDEQLATLLDFLRQSNALSQREIARVREAPSDKEGSFSAPLGDLTSARLVASGISMWKVRGAKGLADLYTARFDGYTPDVKLKDGVVSIRYPRRLTWLPGMPQRSAEVTLNSAIPWQILLQGGASGILAELGGLDLVGLEIKGAVSMIRLDLPRPSDMVPIRISGAASDIVVHRPAGVAARVHLKGWASTFVFDDQRFSNMGNDVRLQSANYDGATPYYDIEVTASVSTATIMSGE
ncbi:MAG TPA: MarR family transcriptional regulator [Ktedonobacterales bacterium]